MAFLSRKELESIGFAKLGDEVLISDKASIHNPAKISLGSFVRIDDFCVLSAGEGGIDIGSYVHISAQATILGQAKITIEDFVAISIKSTIVSSTSDYSGDYLPELRTYRHLLDDELKELFKVINKPVTLKTHSGLGAHSLVLPGVTVGKGTAIGALSMVYQDLNPWGIYMGNPARFVKKRSDKAYRELQKLMSQKNKNKK